MERQVLIQRSIVGKNKVYCIETLQQGDTFTVKRNNSIVCSEATSGQAYKVHKQEVTYYQNK